MGFGLLVGMGASCARPQGGVSDVGQHAEVADSLQEAMWSDTLRVGYLQGCPACFVQGDALTGYDYTLIHRYAERKDVALRDSVFASETELTDALAKGAIDLAVGALALSEKTATAGMALHRVERQPLRLVTTKQARPVRWEDDLYGATIHVQKGSFAALCVGHLASENAGAFEVKEVDMPMDSLMKKVSEGEFVLTVADPWQIRLFATYYKNLEPSLELTLPYATGWVLSHRHAGMEHSLSQWMEEAENSARFRNLRRKYADVSRYRLAETAHPYFSSQGLSPYDDLFRKYANEIGWDWRMIAAIAYEESKFSAHAVSPAGARGLMQLSPETARRMGVSDDDVFDPEVNIKAGVRSLAIVDKIFRRTIHDPEERMKFVLAANNSGIAHIFDARRMADHFGKDRNVWEGHVEDCLKLKSDSTYWSDSTLCRAGYCRGTETVNYVKTVLRRYERFKAAVP